MIGTKLRNILFFTRKQAAVVLAVGLVSGLTDHPTQAIEFALAAKIHVVDTLNDYLSYVTGGPIFGDLLQTWYQWGAILAAYLVRRPAAATLALTINGCCQVFVWGNHDPHLLYGVPGLGADIVFAYYGFRRYDLKTVALAGSACALFWYPVVWFTHGLYTYPLSFIVPDFIVRIVGSAVMNGFLGAGVAIMVLALAKRTGGEWPTGYDGMEAARGFDLGGLIAAVLAVLLIVLTYSVKSVASFFLSVGPKVPFGNIFLEEYNPGYMIGATVIFVVMTLLAFRHLGPLPMRGLKGSIAGTGLQRASSLTQDTGAARREDRRDFVRSALLACAAGAAILIGAEAALGGGEPAAGNPPGKTPSSQSGLVTVKAVYLGMPIEVTGVSEESIALSSPASLQDLLDVVTERHPLLTAMIPTMIKLVDGVAGNLSTVLRDGDEVDFVPATAGG